MAGQGIARLSQVDIAQVVSGTLLMFPDSIQILLLLYTLTKCGICRLVMGQYHSPSGEVISHLNISSVHTRDGGQYSCVATNTVASVRHSARVNIYGDYMSIIIIILYMLYIKASQSLEER